MRFSGTKFPAAAAFAMMFLTAAGAGGAAGLTLSAPLDYQVIQRGAAGRGIIVIGGALADANAADPAVEARMSGESGAQWPVPTAPSHSRPTT